MNVQAATTRWMDQALALQPLLKEAAPRIEAATRLPEDIVAALRDAGMFRLSVPKALGGAQLSLSEQIRVIEAIAAADGASGWCVMIASTTALLAGYMPEATAGEVFGDPARLACGVYAPMGKATAVEGGFRVTGRWPFGSGGQHSHWRLGGALVMTPDGPRGMRLMVFEAEQTRILDDTWDTAGLRGTGSHDFQVEDAFVPEARAIALKAPTREEPLYAMPLFPFLAAEVAAVSLGLARAALDTLRDVAAAKRRGKRSVAARGSVQMEWGRSEARVRSARAWLLECVGALESAQLAGEEPTVEQRAHMRLAACHAAEVAADVTQLMMRFGGGSAIYATSPLQRLFRDANTATAHAMVSPLMAEYVGKVLLGETEDVSQL